MDSPDAEAVAKVADQLEAVVGTLQFQVLNNIDTHVNGKAANPEVLNDFVKRPIMQSVTKIKTARATLARLALNGVTTEKKEVSDNGTRR